MKLKQLLKEFYSFILFLLTKISEDNRNNIIIKLSLILNYLLNSILLSIPLTFILFKHFSLKNYLIIKIYLTALPNP